MKLPLLEELKEKVYGGANESEWNYSTLHDIWVFFIEFKFSVVNKRRIFVEMLNVEL